jgi:antitoxin (DNA-binding transcriptional repressor) of toxin-antitoxin stability system
VRTANAHGSKIQLSRPVEDASKGEEIVIAKAGKPMARPVPLQSSRKPRELGWLRAGSRSPRTSMPPCRTR